MSEIDYKKEYEELKKMYLNLGNVVDDQNKQVDEMINLMSGKLKRSSRKMTKENERIKLFLANKYLVDEYKQFVKSLQK